MVYYIRKKQAYSILLVLFIGFTAFLVHIVAKSFCSFGSCQMIAFLLATFLYVYLIICNYSKMGSRFDCFTLFLIASFPFSYGKHLLCFLGLAEIDKVFSARLTNEALIDAAFYNIYAVIALFIGYTLVSPKKHHRKERFNCFDDNALSKKALRIVSTIFLVISVPFYITYRISDMRMTMESGYGFRIIEGNTGVSIGGLLSSFALPSCTALYVAKKDGSKLPMIVLIALYAADLLAGSRISVICSVFVIFYHYYSTHILNVKRIVLWSGVALVGLSVFAMISADRTALLTNQSWLEFVAKNNILSSVLMETGFTFETSANVIQHCPKDVDYVYGFSYVYAFLYILPNAFTKLTFLNTDDAFAPFMVSYGGIGSSYSAEAFYNFGYVGLLAIVGIGLVWGLLSRELNDSSNNVFRRFFLLEIAFALFIMLRSDIVYRFRALFWFTIPIIIASVLLKSFLKTSKE